MWNFQGQELVVTFPNITFIPYVRILPRVINPRSLKLGADLKLINFLAEVLNFTYV